MLLPVIEEWYILNSQLVTSLFSYWNYPLHHSAPVVSERISHSALCDKVLGIVGGFRFSFFFLSSYVVVVVIVLSILRRLRSRSCTRNIKVRRRCSH